jgi:IS30 family transposase
MAKLTYYERQIIESKRRSKQSARTIAKFLGRDHSVVAREIKRNTGDHLPYTAVAAQRIAEGRDRKRSQKKLEKDSILKAYVVEQLKQDISPEQIAGILKHQPPVELIGKELCHETIYQYIYNGYGQYEYLYPHLRRKKVARRQKRGSRKPQKVLIPERISIHERPGIAAEKTEYGHWESDTVLCKKQTAVLSVQYEKKSQLVRIHKVANKSAPETKIALEQTIDSLPDTLFKTMTFDNGLEGVCHVAIRDEHEIETFFCDAYASWQKGGVENMNGLIRQYIPKDANLEIISDDDIYAIQEKLNNRPRKGLNYLTPNQVIAVEVGR